MTYHPLNLGWQRSFGQYAEKTSADLPSPPLPVEDLALSDSATLAFSITETATETINDAGTCTFALGVPVATPVLDSFNTGANQAVIGGTRAGWHASKLYTGEANYTTDATPTKAVGVAATYTDAVWGTIQPANQEVWITWAGAPANIYLHARVPSLPAATGYYLQWLTNGGVQIKTVGGTILASATQVPAAGDSIKFRIDGSSLEAWYKPSGGAWSPLVRVVDTSYTAGGYIGVESFDGDLDEFGGGALLATASETIIEPPVVTFAQVIDDFNTGPSQALTARTAVWDAGGWPGAASLQTDSVPSYALGTASIYTANISAASFLDAETFAVFAVPAGETYIMARWADGSNYYYLNTVVAAYLRLGRVVAGVDTSLAETQQTISAGDSVGISIVGSRLSSWYRPSGGSWRVVDSVIDTSLAAAGRLAVETYTTTAHIDTFGGGVAGTFAVAPSATNTLADSGTCTLALVPSAAETLADAGSASLVIVATSTETVSDAATNAAVFSFTASETVTGGGLSDAGTVSFVVTPSATEVISDAGTCTLVVAQTATETISDSGTCTLALLPSGAETFPDAGSVVFVLAPSATEAVSDAATNTLVLAPSAPPEVLSDAASHSIVLTPSATQSIVDAATQIVVVAPSATEGPGDAGSVSFTVAETASETVSDSGSQIIVLTPSSSQTSTDAGTCALSVTPTSAETFSDAASTTLVIAPTSDFIWPDSGTCTFVVLPTAAEQFQDSATTIFVVTEADSERESDQGTVPVILTPSGAESIVDSGSQSVVVTPSATETPADAGTQPGVLSQSAAETYIESGSGFVTITPSETGIEQGLATFVVAPSATEQISDAGTATVGITPTGEQTISDAATCFSGITSNAENTTVLDPFNTGANQALTARPGWNAGAIWTGDASLQTDAVPTKASGVGTWNDNYWDTPYADGDFTVVFAGTLSNYFDIYGRLTAVGSPTGYALGINAVTGNWFLGKYVAGVYTDFPSVGTRFNKFPGAGDQARLVVQGQQLSAYYKPSGGTWQLVASASDASITGSGYWGIDVGGTVSPIDAWVGGAIGAPLASETLTDSGTCSLVLVPSAAANDTGTVTIGIAPSGAETLTDSGANAVVVTPSSLETIVDSGSTIVVITPIQQGLEQGNAVATFVTSATEVISDAGTATVGIAPSAAVAIVEFALERVLLQYGALYPGELVYPSDISGPGYVHGYEALIESGTVVVVFPPLSGGGAPDAGTATISISSSAVATIVETASERVLLQDGALYPGDLVYPGDVAGPGYVHGYEAIIESGTVVITFPPLVSAPTDAGSAIVGITPSATVVIRDAGTCSLALAPSATETASDTGVVTLVFPAVQTVNAGTCTFSVGSTATETIAADATIAVQTVVITPSYFGGTPGSLSSQTIVLSQTAVETILGDPSAATCTIVMLPSHTWTAGFDPSPQPPPLSGGDAADRRRHRDALARVRARRAGDPEHRDRKLVRR